MIITQGCQALLLEPCTDDNIAAVRKQQEHNQNCSYSLHRNTTSCRAQQHATPGKGSSASLRMQSDSDDISSYALHGSNLQLGLLCLPVQVVGLVLLQGVLQLMLGLPTTSLRRLQFPKQLCTPATTVASSACLHLASVMSLLRLQLVHQRLFFTHL